MSYQLKVYSALLLVFVLSMASGHFLFPSSDFVKGLIVTPGVMALLGILIQIVRDIAAFENKKYLQLDEQIFKLGATSHMSTLAFNKHVEFCERYMQELHETVRALFHKGPTEEAMKFAEKLCALQREYSAWLPSDISLELAPFENALLQLGSKSDLADKLSGTGNCRARKEALDECYKAFTDILGIDPLPSSKSQQKREEIAAENVKNKVRGILKINELFKIRNFIITRSVNFVNKWEKD